jgi:hypothetical protein
MLLLVFGGVTLMLVTATGLVRRTNALVNPGTTIVSEICQCRFTAHTGFGSSGVVVDANLPVRRAWLGFMASQPAWQSLPSLGIRRNGNLVGTLQPTTLGIAHPGAAGAFMQYVEITSLIRQQGTASGTWSFASLPIVDGVGHIEAFYLSLNDDPGGAVRSVALNDFFFSQMNGQLSTASASVNLQPLPEGYSYQSVSVGTIRGRFEQGQDTSNASYVMGSASGAITQWGWALNPPGSVWGNSGSIPVIDSTATRFTQNINNTASGGNSDTAAFLMFTGPLVKDPVVAPPPPPMIETDTCYTED